MRSKIKSSILDALIIFMAGLYVLLPISPYYLKTVSRDAGVFLYVGWRILQGETPYLNVWDHKPPLIYYINAIGLWLGNDSVWGVWSIECISLLAALGIFMRIIRRYISTSPLVTFASITILAVSLSFFLDGGNLTTEYPLPLQFLLILTFVELYASGTSGWREFLFGILTGLIFFTRQNSIGIALAGALVLVGGHWRTPRSLVAKSLWMGLGFLCIGAVIFLHFYIAGAAAAMWDAAFRFNVLYSQERGWSDRIDAIIRGMTSLSQTGLLPVALIGWLGGALFVFRKNGPLSFSAPMLWLVLIALPVEFALAAWPGRPRVPYFTSVLPVLGVLIALTFEGTHVLLPAGFKWRRAAAVVVILLPVVFALRIAAQAVPYQFHVITDVQHQQAVQFLQDNTAGDDFVLIVGAESAVNFAAHRVSPTRFVYQYPLLRPNYADEAKLLEFYEDILEKKPKYIIATRTEDWPVSIGAKRYDSVRVAASELASHYHLREIMIDWLVWEHTGH